MIKNLFFSIIILFMFVRPGQCQTIEINSKDFVQQVSFPEFYEDKTCHLSLEDIKKMSLKKYKDNILNFGLTKSTIWARIEVKNSTSEKSILEVKNPRLESLEIFVFDEKDSLLKKAEAGLAYKVEDRAYQSPYLVFDLPMNTKTQTIYLKAISNERLRMPIVLASHQTWLTINRNHQMVLGLFYGFDIILLLYTLLIFVSIREKTYLFYFLWGFSTLFYIINFQGFLHYFSSPLYELLKKDNSVLFFTYLFYVYFSIYFLEIKKYLSKWELIAQIILFVAFCAFIFDLFGFSILAYVIYQAVFFAFTIYFIIIAWIIYKKGYPPALIFFFAMLVYSLFFGASILTLYGLLPDYFGIAQYYINIASTLQMLIFSLSLTQKINFLKRKNEKEQEIKNSLLEKLHLVKINALSSQMNPHFIFNLIGSIQNLVLSDKKEAALEYMKYFYNLTKLSLEISTANNITIQQEIDFLKYYIELEKLRKGNVFDALFDIQPQELLSEQIPPMIIQPFVENAILHGFAVKHEKGLISIEIKKEESILRFVVDDNGIGRSESAKLKQRKTHNSMALQMVESRLALMNKKKISENYDLQIEDKYAPDGQALGTKVTIQIPIEQ